MCRRVGQGTSPRALYRAGYPNAHGTVFVVAALERMQVLVNGIHFEATPAAIACLGGQTAVCTRARGPSPATRIEAEEWRWQARKRK
jgi:hypothetical protein